MNGRTIEAVTFAELFKDYTDGSFPVLMDIYHEDITWSSDDTEQEQGHLRLINANYKVKYEGNIYQPAHFNFVAPSEDGKTIGSTSVSISAIDRRIVEVIRGINSKPAASIVAVFAKTDNNSVIFSKLSQYEFEMTNVSWNGVSATWNLIFDPTASLNVPRDLATSVRCPGINTAR